MKFPNFLSRLNKLEKPKFVPTEEYVMEYLGVNNRDDLFNLKKRITENLRGHVRVMVHPLNVFEDPYAPEEVKEKQERAYTHFLKSIESALNNPKSSPLFIFLNKNVLDRYRDSDLSSKNILVLPTYTNFGIPYFDDSKFKTMPPPSLEDAVAKESFDKLIGVFNFLGVKSITISGMYIDIHKTFFSKKLGQCLGAFTRELRRDFKVDISPSSMRFDSTPEETREFLKKHNIVLKQTGDNKSDL